MNTKFLYALIISIFLLFANRSNAQVGGDMGKSTKYKGYYSAWDFGVGAGESHYYGDLTTGVFQKQNIHKNYYAFARYQYKERNGFKLAFNYGQLSGSDAISKKAGLRSRNLFFETKIYELAAQYEYMFRDLVSCQKIGFTPYFTIGLGGFYFNPYAAKYGYLRPLSTEGQGLSGSGKKMYSRINVSVPIGVGVKVLLKSKFIIGAEFAFRKTLSDYIDDVSTNYPDLAQLETERGSTAVAASFKGKVNPTTNYPVGYQRGSAKYKDAYFMSVIYVSYIMFSDCLNYNLYHRNNYYGCEQKRL